MNKYLQTDPWCIIEEGFHADKQLTSESIFSLGNGHIGQRANFEEYYSGETMLGSYIAGMYYPEKSEGENRKEGYPETNNTMLNAPDWTSIAVRLNEERLDLAEWDIRNFRRVLNMQEGFLERTFEAVSINGNHIQVSVKRFLSMAEKEVAAMSYTIKSLNFEGRISFLPVIDGDMRNKSSQDDQFWNILQTRTQADVSHLWAQIRKMDFHVCAALTYSFSKNNEQMHGIPTKIEKEKVAGFSVGTDVRIGDTICLNKYVAILNSLNHPRAELTQRACALARASGIKGWNRLFEEHAAVWAQKWLHSDILIDNDEESLQVLRYNFFQLQQTYTGDDRRLNM